MCQCSIQFVHSKIICICWRKQLGKQGLIFKDIEFVSYEWEWYCISWLSISLQHYCFMMLPSHTDKNDPRPTLVRPQTDNRMNKILYFVFAAQFRSIWSQFDGPTRLSHQWDQHQNKHKEKQLFSPPNGQAFVTLRVTLRSVWGWFCGLIKLLQFVWYIIKLLFLWKCKDCYMYIIIFSIIVGFINNSFQWSLLFGKVGVWEVHIDIC